MRAYAEEHGLTGIEAIEAGMAEKSREYARAANRLQATPQVYLPSSVGG